MAKKKRVTRTPKEPGVKVKKKRVKKKDLPPDEQTHNHVVVLGGGHGLGVVGPFKYKYEADQWAKLVQEEMEWRYSPEKAKRMYRKLDPVVVPCTTRVKGRILVNMMVRSKRK